MSDVIPTDELNALRTRLSNFGHGNWAGKTTTTLDDQLRIAQACVEALDQFDRYEAEIELMKREAKALARSAAEAIDEKVRLQVEMKNRGWRAT